MPAFTRWSLRCLLAVLGVVVFADLASAQFAQPGYPAWYRNHLRHQQNQNPQRGVIVMPSINTMPGIPASHLSRPAYEPLFNPALNNPWMNQTNIIPVRNPFIPRLNNPFAINPLLPNAAFRNPFGVPGFNPNFGPIIDPSSAIVASYTPPIAFQQPGQLIYRGLDFQVNPASGTVYRPISGVATLGNGRNYFRVPGTGLPTPNGSYATGTGLYFNPETGTFFNPRSGVVSKPGQTNVLLPYVW